MGNKDQNLIWEAYKNVPVEEGAGRQAGHIALDIGGAAADFAFPGLGAAFDIPNAAWHASKGEYIMALLSIISVIPYIGDAIGKGGKAVGYAAKLIKFMRTFGKGGRLAAKATVKGKKAVVVAGSRISKIKNAIRENRAAVEVVLDKLEDDERIAEHMPKIRQALDEVTRESGTIPKMSA